MPLRFYVLFYVLFIFVYVLYVLYVLRSAFHVFYVLYAYSNKNIKTKKTSTRNDITQTHRFICRSQQQPKHKLQRKGITQKQEHQRFWTWEVGWPPHLAPNLL